MITTRVFFFFDRVVITGKLKKKYRVYLISTGTSCILVSVCNLLKRNFRWGINKLQEALDVPFSNGLRAVLIFGVPQNIVKVLDYYIVHCRT